MGGPRPAPPARRARARRAPPPRPRPRAPPARPPGCAGSTRGAPLHARPRLGDPERPPEHRLPLGGRAVLFQLQERGGVVERLCDERVTGAERPLPQRDRPPEERRRLGAGPPPAEQQAEPVQQRRQLDGVGVAHPLVAREHPAEQRLDVLELALPLEDGGQLLEQPRQRRIGARRRLGDGDRPRGARARLVQPPLREPRRAQRVERRRQLGVPVTVDLLGDLERPRARRLRVGVARAGELGRRHVE